MPIGKMTRLTSWILLGFVLLASVLTGHAQEKRPVVYVAPIDGIIDLGLAPFVKRVLEEAEQAGAAAVVLDINTFGGRVDAAVQIRDALLASRVRTIAFVNKRAISAGALISLAAHDIVIATVEQNIGREDGGANAGEAKTTCARMAAICLIEVRRPMLVPLLLGGKLSVYKTSRAFQAQALHAMNAQ